MTEEDRKDRIRALERELHGYMVRGLGDRAVEVEKQIALMKGETPVARAERRPRTSGTKRA